MQPPEAEKRGVLIVDDEPQVAAALADALEDDFRIRTTSTPEEALRILQEDKSIAVIISDQRMPGMNGDELLASARKVSMATRILITAYADIAAVIRAVNKGNIFGYIAKPWQPHDLMLTVNKAAEYCELNRSMVEERELLRQIMDSSADAIAIKDREHRYVRLNELEAALLGAAGRADAEGCTAADFLTPERAMARHRNELDVFAAGAPVRDRLEHVAAGETAERWYSSNLSPVRDGLGEIAGLVSITRDVTETRRLDAMKDEFIATVRHELRTPLTAIRGALGLLRTGAINDLGARARKLVDIGYVHSGRLLSLINDLLDSEALEKGEMQFERQPVALVAVVAEAVHASREAAERQQVTIAKLPSLPEVEVDADRDRLRQVFVKLIANAIEATPPGGSVGVAARALKGGMARVSVLDGGPGVPEDFRPRLFKRFSQADSSDARAKGGIGLGLYIARSIVEAHGGTIGYFSHPEGAEFHVDLPVRPRHREYVRPRLRRLV